MDKPYLHITCIEPRSSLILSLTICLLELGRCDADFKKSSQRPYFVGHERFDVVAYRLQFINCFLERTGWYYTVTEDDTSVRQISSQNPPCILICEYQNLFLFRSNLQLLISFSSAYDGSMFVTDEMSAKMWLFGDEKLFYENGNGTANMVSKFLVQHPNRPFLHLSQTVYEHALAEYSH